MNSLFYYAALIQFVGAFNFAFVTDFFESRLSRHFMDIKDKAVKSFNLIHSKITTDLTSVESVEPLVQNEKSNKKELDIMINEYKSLMNNEFTHKENIHRDLNSMYSPQFTPHLFLLAGIFSTVMLFVICRLEHVKNDAITLHEIHWQFIVYSAMIILGFITICVTEFINFFSNDRGIKWMTLTKVGIYSVVISPIIVFSVPYYEDLHNQLIAHISFYLIFLPFAAFIFSILFFFVINMPLWLKIEWRTRFLNYKWKKLTKKKDKVLDPYKHLTSDNLTLE